MLSYCLLPHQFLFRHQTSLYPSIYHCQTQVSLIVKHSFGESDHESPDFRESRVDLPVEMHRSICNLFNKSMPADMFANLYCRAVQTGMPQVRRFLARVFEVCSCNLMPNARATQSVCPESEHSTTLRTCLPASCWRNNNNMPGVM